MPRNLGPQVVNVIPVNSLSNPVEPYTLDELAAIFADSEWNRFWREASSGQIGPWSANVVPYQTMDDSASPINYNGGNPVYLRSFAQLRSLELLGSIRAGTEWVYFFLPPFPGVASSTGLGRNQCTIIGRAWAHTIAHETGHGLNWDHAKGQFLQDGASTIAEYGDVYSVMGNSYYEWQFGQPSFRDKLKCGWFGLDRLQVVTASGDYALQPFERPIDGGPLSLSIAVPNQLPIDVEYRIDGSKMRTNPGVIVRRGAVLLDVAPNSDVNYRIDVGQSVTFDDGTTIAVLAAGTDVATIRVLFPGSPVPTPVPPPVPTPEPVPAPVPVDCVLSAPVVTVGDWSAWTVDGGLEVRNRTITETRAIATEPANGGAPCGPLVTSRLEQETRPISTPEPTPIPEPEPAPVPAPVPAVVTLALAKKGSAWKVTATASGAIAATLEQVGAWSVPFAGTITTSVTVKGNPLLTFRVTATDAAGNVTRQTATTK